MPFPAPTGWVSPEEQARLALFTNPDGTINQQALFEATMAANAQYNPEGDPSLGANVDLGWSGLRDQYGNTGVRHFTPEELAQNGGAPMTFFTGSSPGLAATTTDPQEIASLRDDQRTRMQQSAAQIAALIAGGTALTGGFGGGAAAGAGAGEAATTYPYVAGGPVTVSSIPGVTAGTAAGAGAAAAGGILDSSGAAIPGLAGAGAAAGGNFLQNWLPYITGGVNTLLGARAADQASDAESAALQSAIEEQRRQFDTTRNDLMPWLTAGQGALNRLQDPNAFTASPGYEWARNEGIRDIGNSFAARGGAASGNALRALSEFQTGLAQQDYNNWWNRQAGLAGVGQNTATNLGSLGQNTASNVGNYLADQGVSRASGVLGKYGSLAEGLNQGVSNWLYRRRAA